MRVLYVDDDALNRLAMRSMLDIAGVKMDEAEDGPSGLRLIDENEYDLVLMDLRMPEMDGLQALRTIRSLPNAKSGLTVIIVTADTAPDLLSACLCEGADDLLRKPVEMDALFDAVARVTTRQGGGV